MSEKPAFTTLKNLFQKEWHTAETLYTDENGCASFRGFFGTYRLEIETPDGYEEKYVTFTKDSHGEISVQI